MIKAPLLIVGKELSDLANKLGSESSKEGIIPVLAEDDNTALEIYREVGPRLMLTILKPNAQEVHDRLKVAGYRGAFAVYAHESYQSLWGKRQVKFIDPAEQNLYERIKDATFF